MNTCGCLPLRKEPMNPYEELARLKKVDALFDLLRKHGVSAEVARHLDQQHWGVLAKELNIKAPSALTVKGVIERLEAESANVH